jgi:hypothetical protein
VENWNAMLFVTKKTWKTLRRRVKWQIDLLCWGKLNQSNG